jgi:hypothetical protein
MLKPFPKATTTTTVNPARRGPVIQSHTAAGAAAAAAAAADRAADAAAASAGSSGGAANAVLSAELSQVAYSVKRLGNVYGVQCAAAAAQLQVLLTSFYESSTTNLL